MRIPERRKSKMKSKTMQRTALAITLAAALAGCSQKYADEPVAGLDLAVAFRQGGEEQVVSLAKTNIYAYKNGKFKPLNRNLTFGELSAIQQGRNPGAISEEEYRADWKNQYFINSQGRYFPISNGNILTASDGLGYYDTVSFENNKN